MSKSYLAPKDDFSIPCFKLLGSVTSVKMDRMLSSEMHMELGPSIF